MLAKVHSIAVHDIDAIPVEIEVNCPGHGNIGTILVGLPDAAMCESGHRVYTAIQNNGFHYHRGAVTINLAPADVPKEGPSFELPIMLDLARLTAIVHDRRQRLGQLHLPVDGQQ